MKTAYDLTDAELRNALSHLERNAPQRTKDIQDVRTELKRRSMAATFYGPNGVYYDACGTAYPAPRR